METALAPITWNTGKTKLSNGLTFCWESAGNETAPTVLLVAGLACQLTMWHNPFCLALLKRGYRVVRFDNRDAGLTSDHPHPFKTNVYSTFMRYHLRMGTPANYTLETMADDTLELIDGLELKKPHLVGISMGGMITQIAAAKQPEKVNKIVLLMSSTNCPTMPVPSLSVLVNMFIRKPKSSRIDDVVEHVERVMRTIGSPAYPLDRDLLHERTREAYKRAFRPEGILRQTQSVIATGSIENFTQRIKAPACIIHGLADPLLKPSCAERLNKLIPNSKVRFIEGLGHDLPDPLSERFSTIMHEHLA